MNAMQRYYWQGIDLNGKSKRGWTVAAERDQLKDHLLQHQIMLQHAVAMPKWLEQGLDPANTRINAERITSMLRELAILLDAGVPILQAFEILAAQVEHTGMRHLLGRLRERVASGLSLSAALHADIQRFDPLLIALIRAGEASSQLIPLLHQIAEHRQRIARMQGALRRALFYPSIVLGLALVVTLALMIWVVPRFEALFADFGAELPAFTQIVIQASDHLRALGWTLVGLIAAAVMLAGVLPRYSRQAADWRDWLWLKTPVAGALIHRGEIARFTRTLAIMIRAGVPLTEALPGIAQTMRNRCYQQAVMVLFDGIRDGHTIAHAIRQARPFPGTLSPMIAVAEASGEIERMLEHIADREALRLNEAITGLARRLEPMVMALLGVLVGGLVLAMYLPVFQLGNAL